MRVDDRGEIAIAHPGTDADITVAHLDPPQPVEMPDEDGEADGAQEFRDPQPHIRGPGDDGRLGRIGVDLGEIVHVRGQDGAVLLGAGHHPRAIAQRRQPGRDAVALLHKPVAGGGAVAGGGLRRADDRRIPGAAAKVALKGGFDLSLVRLGRLHPERVERHHDPRRAKAALAAMFGNHCLLHRV